MRTRSSMPALLLTAALVLSACAGSDDTSGQDGTIRLAVSRMAAGVDPVDDESSSYLRSYGAGESLTKLDPEGVVRPELAESVTRSAPTTWTITLREGATFWSGETVDGEAVLASLERSRAESALAAGLLDGVRLEVSGPGTVEATTDEPDPYLGETLANYALTIHNVSAYEGAGRAADAESADLTGPFRITDFGSQRSVSLERNDRWWGGEVASEAVEVQLVPDEQSRAELAIAGQADLVQEVPVTRVAEVEQAGARISERPNATTVAVYLNPRSDDAPALGDVRVRRALAMAVDREEVVELATEGLSEPSPSWLASSPAYPRAKEQGFTSFDPEGAARLLDAAGWTEDAGGVRRRDGRPLTFRMMTFGAEVPTAEVLQSQWREIGADVKVQTVESTLINQARAAGDWDTFTQAWTTLGYAPDRLAGQVGPGGAVNHGEYVFPEVPDLLRKATSAADAADRDEAVYALNELIADQVPLVPVHPRVTPTAVAAGVEGFVDHPLSYENLIQPGMRVG